MISLFSLYAVFDQGSDVIYIHVFCFEIIRVESRIKLCSGRFLNDLVSRAYSAVSVYMLSQVIHYLAVSVLSEQQIDIYVFKQLVCKLRCYGTAQQIRGEIPEISIRPVHVLQELQNKIFYDQPTNIFENNFTERPEPFTSDKLVVYGIDIGKTRNETVLYIAEVGEEYESIDRTLDVKYKKEFPLGTEYSEIENYLIYELPKRFPNIRRGIIDATGVGAAIYEKVEKMVKKSRNPYPVEPFIFSVKTKREVVEFGVSAMEQGKVKVKYNKRLSEEMTGYKRELTKDNNFIYDKGAGSDDYVDAMNLCIFNMALGLNFKPPIIVKQVPKAVVKSFGDKTWRNKKQRPNRHSKKIMNIPRRRL